METLTALLAHSVFCGNSSGDQWIPLAIWPMMRSFDIFFSGNKSNLVNKSASCRRFETQRRSRDIPVWASYQIRKIAGCACAENAGNVFPPLRVSDPDIHRGTCVTHVPWCMSGSLTSGVLFKSVVGKTPRHSRGMHNLQVYVSGKRPMVLVLIPSLLETHPVRTYSSIFRPNWCFTCINRHCITYFCIDCVSIIIVQSSDIMQYIPFNEIKETFRAAMVNTWLTHWGRDKMAAVSQTTLSNAFSWMKMLEFRLRFHWSLFLRVQLTIIQHWFR